MAAGWSDVVAAAGKVVDDIRDDEKLKKSPALYFREMAGRVRLAVPLLSRPPELMEYIRDGTVEPEWGDAEWVSDDESTLRETAAETGLAGFELCSVTRRVLLPSGRVELVPYPEAAYDPETGTVTFPPQDSGGLVYQIDCYTDGQFPDLTDAQLRLFALAMAQVWNERFSNDYLSMVPKNHDDSFDTVNEANYQDKSSARVIRKRTSFNAELRAYEQLCSYLSSPAAKCGKRRIVLA